MIPLPQVKIATPCHESWEAMPGNERQRHCGVCRKDVYNLSAMTAEDAQALIASKDGRLCARVETREDGAMVTGALPFRRNPRVAISFGWAVALIVAGVIGLPSIALSATRHKQTTHKHQKQTHHMGYVKVPPPAIMGLIAPREPEIHVFRGTPSHRTGDHGNQGTVDQPGNRATMGDIAAPSKAPPQLDQPVNK